MTQKVPRRRTLGRVTLGFVAASAAAVFTGVALAAITSQPATPAGAAAIANAMAATPGIVLGAEFVSSPPGGTPNGTADSALTQFPTNGTTFGILTSGNVQNVDDPGTFTSVNDGGPAVRGMTDRDVSVLRIDLNAPAASNCLTFDFKFLSEEFPFYVGSQFNDAFIAELDATTWTTTASTITAPNNFAFDGNGDVVSINSTGIGGMTPAQGMGTAYDGGGSTTIPPPDGGSAGGGTVLLSASTQITPGPHALYLSIFDQGDQILDSAVFLDNLRIGFVPDPAMNCKPGATPVLFSMTLDPATAENPAGTTHTVTATLRDGDGNLVPNAPISFTVMGANTASGISMTDAGGQAQFTYTGNNLGADVIAACFDFDGNGSCEAQASATKTWVIGPPATLTLEPPAAINTVGTQHCVTATVRDLAGNLVPNAVVEFTVTGANTASGTATTDAFGRATFCYLGGALGVDLITADVPNTPASDTAEKTWVAPAVDHYQCYDADQEGTKNKKKVVVTLEDQFNRERVILSPDGMCNPVSKNGEPVVQPGAHLKSYGLKDARGGDFPHFQKRRVTVENQFGTERFKVVKPEVLLAPSSKSLIPPAARGADSGPPPPFVDHYKCYKAVDAPRHRLPVSLVDQFGSTEASVYRAELLCNPVIKKEHDGAVTEILLRAADTPDHLVCYDLKRRGHDDDDDDDHDDDHHFSHCSRHDHSDHRVGRLVNMHDQFGRAVLKVEDSETLCVPSKKLKVEIVNDHDDDDDHDHDDDHHHHD